MMMILASAVLAGNLVATGAQARGGGGGGHGGGGGGALAAATWAAVLAAATWLALAEPTSEVLALVALAALAATTSEASGQVTWRTQTTHTLEGAVSAAAISATGSIVRITRHTPTPGRTTAPTECRAFQEIDNTRYSPPWGLHRRIGILLFASSAGELTSLPSPRLVADRRATVSLPRTYNRIVGWRVGLGWSAKQEC